MGPIHIGLDIASKILGKYHEDNAKAIVDVIFNALPIELSM